MGRGRCRLGPGLLGGSHLEERAVARRPVRVAEPLGGGGPTLESAAVEGVAGEDGGVLVERGGLGPGGEEQAGEVEAERDRVRLGLDGEPERGEELGIGISRMLGQSGRLP